MHILKTVFAVFTLTLCVRAAAAANQDISKLWQIGKPDQSYMEFSPAPAETVMNGYQSAFEDGFKIKAGKKSKKGNFPGLQAGPAAAWGGYREYPVKIYFELPGAAAGGYVLTAGLAGAAPNMDGTLSVNVNDSELSAEIAAGAGTDVLNFPQGFADPQTVRFYLPPEAIPAGRNIITLTLTHGEWIIYDFLRLEAVPAGVDAALNFSAASPPFLANAPDGPGHLMDVSFFYVGAEDADAQLTARAGNAEVKTALQLKRGQTHAVIVLPEQDSETTAQVALLSRGRELAVADVPLNPVRHFAITLIPHSHLDIGYPDQQPNIMIGQQQYLEKALEMIGEETTGAKMAWMSEVAWPVYKILLGQGPYETYGQWLDGALPMKGTSEEFLKQVPHLRDEAMFARVESSTGSPDDLNNRRAVDGSPQGWRSVGPARGAWFEMTFKAPTPLAYVGLRGGRETDNQIKKLRLTFTLENGQQETRDAGPLGVYRERFLVSPPDAPVTNLRVDILDAADPDQPASLMEIEAWTPRPAGELKTRLMNAVGNGRLEVGGLYMNFLTQLIPTEWLIRSMLRSSQTAEAMGAPLRTALLTDVPGASFALPDILSGAGIRYFYPALNPDRAYSCLDGMPHAFIWQGSAGGRVIVFRAFNTYNEGWWLGLGQSAALAEQKLPAFLESLTPDEYPYDLLPLRMLGDITDDGPVPERLPRIVDEWNKKWAWPKLEIGTATDFFERFDTAYANELPVLIGDWTSYWEDGAGSTAAETALVRELHHKLSVASSMLALMPRKNIHDIQQEGNRTFITTGSMFDRTEDADMFEDLALAEEGLYLYDEHTWGADTSIREPNSPRTLGQWHFKQQLLLDALERTDHILEHLEPLVDLDILNCYGVIAAINMSGQPRSGLISIPLDSDDIFDSALDTFKNAPVPSAIVEQDGTPHLVFFAEDVPSVGFTHYLKSRSKDSNSGMQPPATPGLIENDRYRIDVDTRTGQITHILDKANDHDMVDPATEYGMNEFVYAQGVEQTPVRLSNVWVSPGANNSLYSELVITGSAPNIPEITQIVRLHHAQDMIEFENRITKQAVTDKEAGYIAFPFNAPGGTLRFEVTGGLITPEKDQLPGASRLWMAMQNGAAAVSDNYSILFSTRDAPLITPQILGDNAGADQQSDTMFFSYIFNNYWHTNYMAAQGGDFTFRYAITGASGKASDTDIIRFGSRYAEPMTGINIKSKSHDRQVGFCAIPYDTSLISVAPDTVHLLGIKPAEQGKGIVIRLQEIAGDRTNVRLSLSSNLRFSTAHITDLMEHTISKATTSQTKDRVIENRFTEGGFIVEAEIGPHGYLTLKLE